MIHVPSTCGFYVQRPIQVTGRSCRDSMNWRGSLMPNGSLRYIPTDN